MSEVSFEAIQREPMCQYCGTLPAVFYVITVSGDVEQRYAACHDCQIAVANGLHECDYTCREAHYELRQGPLDPNAQEWLQERLLWSGRAHYDAWMKAGLPALREENGQVVWSQPAPTEGVVPGG